MAENDITELIWQHGQIVRRRQPPRPTSDNPSSSSSPPPHVILRGSGSGEGNALFHDQPSHQNLFIQEDEMASWILHPQFYSHLLESGIVSTTQPPSSDSQPPLPPPQLTSLYDLPPERSSGQVFASRRAGNFMNLSRLRGNNIFTDEGGLCIPVVRESTKVGSSATPSSSATESSLTPATQGTETLATVSQTFAVPSLDWKEKAVAFEDVRLISGPSSSVVSKPDHHQPATQIADDRKRKEREENIHETHETKEAPDSSSARKKLRATKMHNISERKRREKINEKMKALQELIPRCNKSDKVSMLNDAIEYVKLLQTQIQIMSMGSGGVMPMMYMANMQQFMPHMMGMNRPPFVPFSGSAIPRPAHVSRNIQAFEPGPMANQPQFPGYLNPYSQSVALQQPPPFQNQTPSHLSFSQASSSKEPEDQENKPTS